MDAPTSKNLPCLLSGRLWEQSSFHSNSVVPLSSANKTSLHAFDSLCGRPACCAYIPGPKKYSSRHGSGVKNFQSICAHKVLYPMPCEDGSWPPQPCPQIRLPQLRAIDAFALAFSVHALMVASRPPARRGGPVLIRHSAKAVVRPGRPLWPAQLAQKGYLRVRLEHAVGNEAPC